MNAKVVLLVEPDKILGSVYASALRAKGYDVCHVMTAQEAVIAADERCPDIVVCEIQLVRHSGIEFLYEFRSYTDWQTIPVIILSSVPAMEFDSSRNGLQDHLGVHKYLYKPSTSLAQLLRMIEDSLSVNNAATQD